MKNALLGGIGAITAIAIGIGLWTHQNTPEGQPQSLKVLHTSGNATINGQKITQGQIVENAEGSIIQTGEHGFITIQADDGGTTQVMSDSKLSIEKAQKTQEGFESRYQMDFGEITQSIPEDQKAVRRYSLTTDSATIGVRGTVFTVNHDGEHSRLMVDRGKVAAQGKQGSEILVSAGKASLIRKGAAASTPVTLPPSPSLSSPQAGERNIEQFPTFVWKPTPSTIKWEIQVASDQSFNTLLYMNDSSTPKHVLGMDLPKDDTYYWRVASLDINGLRGPWSDGQAFIYKHNFESGRQALLNEQKEDLAIEHFRRGQGNLEEESQLLQEDAAKQLQAGSAEKAEARFEILREIDPDNTEAQVGIAYSQLKQGKLDTAKKEFEVALTKTDDLDARMGVAQIALKEGNSAEALKQVQRVLDITPDRIDALETASVASLNLGQIAQADGYIQKILALEPDNEAAQIMRQSLEMLQ